MTAAKVNSHRRLAVALAARGDTELAGLMAEGRSATVGVGGSSSVIDIDGAPVFAKRVPLSERELAHPGCTANFFDVPTYCQYGIGGPSFNTWRELAANTMVTEAVLRGETGAFPMLYHWRVLPGRSPIAEDHADIDAVVAAQGDSPAVRARLEALVVAPASLALFCEYIPNTVADLLSEDPASKALSFAQQLSEIVTFLRGRRLLHMDCHFGNLRSAGDRIYLTDFGLATSPLFDLSPAERAFVDRHAGHDADYAAMRLVNWLATDVCGASRGYPPVGRNEFVRRCASGRIPDDVPPVVAALLARHAPAAARLNAFFWKLFDGEVHAEYPSGSDMSLSDWTIHGDAARG
ncbi:serine/threonine protein phosphatase [Nocardia sp. NPDC048505]|uniref:serine/threonine protein phosphatase n=1 Tax=unclassified Nocardia TaxID=2637762 RepID=UPI0034060BEC